MSRASKNIVKSRLIFTRTSKAFRAFVKEISKTDGTVKGDVFEDFARKKLFPKKRYKLIHRSPSYDKKDFNESLLLPDFIFGIEDFSFAVETKYRKSLNDEGCLSFCTGLKQLERYKQFEKNEGYPVFILIGLGGSPYSPSELFLLPASKLFNHQLPPDQLSNCRVSKTIIEMNNLMTMLDEKVKVKHGTYARF